MIFILKSLLVVAFSHQESIMSTCIEAEQLDLDCNQMIDKEKMNLALRLTKCHFEASHKIFKGCHDSQTPSCLSRLDDEEWNTYTQFYLHVENHCQFISIQNFQNSLLQYSSGVVESSSKILNKLEYQSHKQGEVKQISDQNYKVIYDMNLKSDQNRDMLSVFIDFFTKEYQKQQEQTLNSFISQMNELLRLLVESQITLDKVMIQISQYMVETENSIQKIFENQRYLNQIGFYGVSILIILILTSSKKTQRDRSSCFMIITICYIFEVFMRDIEVYIVRLSCWVLIILKLYICIHYYKDFEELTYREIKVISSKIDGIRTPHLKLKLENVLKQIVLSISKKNITNEKE